MRGWVQFSTGTLRKSTKVNAIIYMSLSILIFTIQFCKSVEIAVTNDQKNIQLNFQGSKGLKIKHLTFLFFF